jgi:hypothetical protein
MRKREKIYAIRSKQRRKEEHESRTYQRLVLEMYFLEGGGGIWFGTKQ